MIIAIYTLSGVITALLFFIVYLLITTSRERKDLYDRIQSPTIHDYYEHRQTPEPQLEPAEDDEDEAIEIPDVSPTPEFIEMQPQAEAEISTFLRM